jgi:hypothetical protein
MDSTFQAGVDFLYDNVSMIAAVLKDMSLQPKLNQDR